MLLRIALQTVSLLGALALASTAHSQQLRINNQQTCDLQGSVSITASGDIEVEVVDPDTCLNLQGGFAISPLVVVPDVIGPGGSTVVGWSSVGAISCQLNVPSGWAAPTNVGLTDTASISAPSAAAPDVYSVDVTCLNDVSDSVTAAAQVTVEQQVSNPPAVPSLSRNVTDPVAPGEIVLTWSSSTGASNCEARSTPTLAAWNGSVGTGSNQQVTLSDLSAGSYTLELRCSNSAGSSAWASVGGTISSSTQCADRLPPTGWNQLSSCYYESLQGWSSTADCSDWNPGITNIPFYEESGNNRRMALAGRPDAQQYLAIEIDTTGMSPSDSGRLTFADDFFATPTPYIATISSCPGDFHETAIQNETGCYKKITAGFSPPLRWGGTASGETCQLQTDTVYYLNLLPTTSAAGTDPDLFEAEPACEEGACGWIFQWQ